MLALGIVAALSVWVRQTRRRIDAVALGSIIGGALGNVVDRVLQGAVTDFLDFHLAGHHWPAFNMADVAVVTGASLLALSSFRETSNDRCGRLTAIALALTLGFTPKPAEGRPWETGPRRMWYRRD